jgi:dihydropyrimidinase
MSILITGGTVITAAETQRADIYIDGEKVVAIGSQLPATATRTIDARGRYVIPGCVDPHTHLDLPFAGTVTCDDFTSGTIAAAFGGTTSHIDFVIQQPGQTLHDALAMWQTKLQAHPPVIDVGFHLAITDLHTGSLDELDEIVAKGISSIKLFMAYKGSLMVTDDTIVRVMQRAHDLGALVMVHAENGDAIEVLIEQARLAGHHEPRWHAQTRPPLLEGEATSRAIQLARMTGCPLYVVHVSCAEAIEPIRKAREQGWPVWAETCTHYLFIDETFLDLPNFEGAKYVYSPPARDKTNQAQLWHALERDVLSIVGTDHAPFRFADQKREGIKDFTKIPNGAPGIEDRLLMIHHFGVGGKRISINRMVELLATNPARLFGLYPRKGHRHIRPRQTVQNRGAEPPLQV